MNLKLDAFLLLSILISASSQAAEWLTIHGLDGTVPRAARLEYDSRDEALCKGKGDVPTSPSSAERALISAGWLLWRDPISSGKTTVLLASKGLDGQCRDQGISAFVFVDGKASTAFVPKQDEYPIIATLEGSLLKLELQYAKPDDPRCCPTGSHQLTLALDGFHP